MRESQRGFTLVELVVAIAIAAMLLAAGGVWLGSMHPGALRAAVDDFDADLAVARATAASSGNGATIAVLPRADRQGTHPGFELRVYSGRPNAANAVAPTNAMAIESSAALTEKSYGKPPFAIFLSSAGLPSGMASYPAVDANGTPVFSVVAAQPPCPNGGIVLTFTSPQGATDTRTLQCGVTAVGTPDPDPSPTPNVPVVVPKQLVAHWTSDNAALHFVAAEFGYTHWFASATGSACGSSAVYRAGWPYSVAPDPAEATLAPLPPNAPYSWPQGPSMNDAPAAFSMLPVKNAPGVCAIDVVDEYGQHAGASVQVMGDLSVSPASLTFASAGAAAQSITLAKTFDSETIALKTTDNCSGIASYSVSASSTPATPSTVPASTSIKVTPRGAGQCDIRIGDQYGEPAVDVHVTVNNAVLSVWPPAIQFPVSGSQLAARSVPELNVASTLNRLLGGAVADAAMAPCAVNQPRAFASAAAMTADSTPLVNASDPWGFGLRTDSNGCLTGPGGSVIVVHEGGYSGAFVPQTTCGFSVNFSGWTPSRFGPTAAQIASAGMTPVSACTIQMADQNSITQKAVVEASVVSPACDPKAGDICASVTREFFQCYSWVGAYLDRTCIDFKKWQATTFYISDDGANSWTATGSVYASSWQGSAYAVTCPANWGQQSLDASPAYAWAGGSTESGPIVPSWFPRTPPSIPGTAIDTCT